MKKLFYWILTFLVSGGVLIGQRSLMPVTEALYEKVVLANSSDSIAYDVIYRAYSSHESKQVVEERKAILIRHKENYRLDFGDFVIIQYNDALLQVDGQMMEILYKKGVKSSLSELNLVPTKAMLEHVKQWKWYEEGKELILIAHFHDRDPGPFERIEFRLSATNLLINKLTLLYRQQASFYFPDSEEAEKPRLEIFYRKKTGRFVDINRDFSIESYLDIKADKVRLLPKWQEYKLRVL